MTKPAATRPIAENVARDNARVDFQAGVIHGDVTFYQLRPDSTPQEKFDVALKYLDARVRDEARRLIERAVAGGYATTKVQFYRLIAMLSGRTLRQLANEELDRLAAICASLPRLDGSDEWAAGLKVVLRLLGPAGSADTEPTDTELVVKEIDVLNARQRDAIYSHLEALLEGAVQEEMWHRAVALAEARRMDGDRANRVWKFFHPTPAPPRTRPVRPPAIAGRDILILGAGSAMFCFACARLFQLAAAHGRQDLVFGLIACLVALVAFCVSGADRYYRGTKLRAKEAEVRLPRQWGRAPSPGGFAAEVDRLFDRYFARYVPRGTRRSYWLEQTAGIRRHLRDEIVDLYREQRIAAERVAWLVRYLVRDVRTRWEQDTLTAFRRQLRTPARTMLVCLGGIAVLVGSGFWVVPVTVTGVPLSGTAWLLLAAVSTVPAVRASFRIVAERRRVAADSAERATQDEARWAEYNRWCARLADKPSDTELAAWLESDRKVLVDQAMRQHRLRPSHVIAHAFIEAPASPCKRARYPQGPWRYSRYHLLLFLLTVDGVRQVAIELDFEKAEAREVQRLNYRFDAVAAVHVEGIAAQAQTFMLTLVSGEYIAVRVSEPVREAERHDESDTRISELSLDAAGLGHTLHVLEGVAAEGREWVQRRRDRAKEKLDGIADAIRERLSR